MVVRRGGRRRRRRANAAVAAATISVVGIAAAVALLGRGPSQSPGIRGNPPATPAPASTTAPHASFRVAAPQLDFVGGPAPWVQRPCRPSDISADAALT